MIRTIYQFGQHLREVEDMKPYFEIAAAPYPEKGTGEVVIVAEIKNKRFQKITTEAYKSTLVPKYLYRELASSNSTSLVPTLHFFRDEDKVNNKTGGNKLNESCEKFLGKLKRCIEANKGVYAKYFDAEDLQKGLNSYFETFVRERFSEKKNYLFTLQIDEKWLGEIPDIAAILENTSYDKYFRDSKGELFLGRDKTCAVTYQKNVPEVWGRVDTLGFTVNDIAFSRNGFNAKDSYKMFPVSPDAVRVLEGTMRALDKQLSFNFAGLKFIVLPHFVTLGDDLSRKKNIARKFVKAITTQEIGFDPVLNSIVYSEGIFSNIIEDFELGQNSVYYDIFFYEEKQAQFAIKLHVSDVLPSRFRKIREVKRQITSFYQPVTFKQFKNKDTFTFSPSFYNIKDYFAIKREKETIIEPYFFKVAEAIFHKNRLDEEQVLRAFMHKIVLAFKNAPNNSFAFTDHVKHSFCIHQFFQKLQLFGNMEQEIKKELALTAIEFVNQHSGFFDNHLKRAAFYLGCATEKLLNHQDRRYAGNKPFTKNLLNLYIDFKGMGEIFHKLRKKADEYSNDTEPKFPYTAFNKILSEFGEEIGRGDSDDVTKTEISYAFSLGLTMEKEFRYRRGQKNGIDGTAPAIQINV